MKRRLLAFLLAALLTAAAVPVLAAPASQVSFTIGQAAYTVDGQLQTMDVAPFIENDRTFVPVRYLALALGVPNDGIAWDGAAQTVTLTKEGLTVSMVIGNNTITVGGQLKQMDVAPLIRNNRTFLPARYVAEALGYKVDWDGARQMVLISPAGQKSVSGEVYR